jgi:hypothetical protein
MLWRILPQRMQRFLSKNAFESTKFAKLNQYKALRTFLFIKAKNKKNLAFSAIIFFSLSIGVRINQLKD